MSKHTKIKRWLPAAGVSTLLVLAFLLPATPVLGSLLSVYTYGYIGRLGGTLIGGPRAGANGTTIDVYVVGTDKAIWYQTTTTGSRSGSSSWSGWASAGGTATSDPGTVRPSGTESNVTVRGTDNAVWHRQSLSGVWQAWESVGGTATSAPSIGSWGPGRLDYVVEGTDSALWHRSETGGVFSGWDTAGGTAASDPAIVDLGVGSLAVFVKGTDGQLFYRTGNGAGTWGTWTGLGGVLTSAPAAASCGLGHIDVVVRGTDSAYWHNSWNGTAWSGWTQVQATGGVAGTWTSSPGVSCDNTGLTVFGRDTANGLTYFTEIGT